MTFRIKIYLGEIATLEEGIGEIPLSELYQLCFDQKSLETTFSKFIEETKTFIRDYFKNLEENYE